VGIRGGRQKELGELGGRGGGRQYYCFWVKRVMVAEFGGNVDGKIRKKKRPVSRKRSSESAAWGVCDGLRRKDSSMNNPSWKNEKKKETDRRKIRRRRGSTRKVLFRVDKDTGRGGPVFMQQRLRMGRRKLLQQRSWERESLRWTYTFC